MEYSIQCCQYMKAPAGVMGLRRQWEDDCSSSRQAIGSSAALDCRGVYNIFQRPIPVQSIKAFRYVRKAWDVRYWVSLLWHATS